MMARIDVSVRDENLYFGYGFRVGIVFCTSELWGEKLVVAGGGRSLAIVFEHNYTSFMIIEEIIKALRMIQNKIIEEIDKALKEYYSDNKILDNFAGFIERETQWATLRQKYHKPRVISGG